MSPNTRDVSLTAVAGVSLTVVAGFSLTAVAGIGLYIHVTYL